MALCWLELHLITIFLLISWVCLPFEIINLDSSSLIHFQFLLRLEYLFTLLTFGFTLISLNISTFEHGLIISIKVWFILHNSFFRFCMFHFLLTSLIRNRSMYQFIIIILSCIWILEWCGLVINSLFTFLMGLFLTSSTIPILTTSCLSPPHKLFWIEITWTFSRFSLYFWIIPHEVTTHCTTFAWWCSFISFSFFHSFFELWILQLFLILLSFLLHWYSFITVLTFPIFIVTI